MEVVRLRPHPTTPCAAVTDLTVAVEPAAELRLAFALRGDLAALAIPAPAAPGVADELWRHTCFEIFAAPDDGERYVEFNFSPSGQWAAYAFAAYRQRVEPAPRSPAPALSWRRAADHLLLTAAVPLPAPRRLGLAAVIETGAGGLSYWALRHPAARPDFHHADGFALRLAPC